MAISVYEIEILKRLPLFQHLPTETIYELVGDASARSYSRRHLLFLQGDEASAWFVVLTGWIKVYRNKPTGEEAVIEVFGPGESFAEAAVFGSGFYPVTAEVVSDARLLVIPSDSFRAHLTEQPNTVLNMLGSLSARLKAFVRRTEHTANMTAAQQVGDFMLRFCRDPKGSASFHLPYDKSLIAARLGMKPETFSRSLVKLRDVGVSVNGSEVVISDVNELRAHIEGDEKAL